MASLPRSHGREVLYPDRLALGEVGLFMLSSTSHGLLKFQAPDIKATVCGSAYLRMTVGVTGAGRAVLTLLHVCVQVTRLAKLTPPPWSLCVLQNMAVPEGCPGK